MEEQEQPHQIRGKKNEEINNTVPIYDAQHRAEVMAPRCHETGIKNCNKREAIKRKAEAKKSLNPRSPVSPLVVYSTTGDLLTL